MNLKQLFPISYKYVHNTEKLIIGILIYLVIGIVGGAIVFVGSLIPIINILFWILGSLLDLYVLAGIIILLLVHTNVIE